ncbi:hypothetical protein VNI00_013870 [Paramarasmius palmivorus]|uniref:F-box domain-containing protein n=1 Tax=Paramarasmius palmivorus TaxID=297713 RepID=A0AAW0BXI0_9AGAR
MDHADVHLFVLAFPNKQRLCDELVVDILEQHIEAVGVQGNVGLLLLNRAISQRLYLAFYRSVKLWTFRQLLRLYRTLRLRPHRAPFVKALWISIGNGGEMDSFAFRFYTLDYPHKCAPFQAHWIDGGDATFVRGLLEITAPFVERLTIQGNLLNPRILITIVRSLQFPNATHLELPVTMAPTWALLAVPRLTHLRLAIHLRFQEYAEWVRNCTLFPFLSHVYLSIHGDIVEASEFIRHFKTPATVQALAIEMNMGQQVAVECRDLWMYDVHPKVVFMVDERWVQTAARGLEQGAWERLKERFCLLPENEQLVEQLTDLILVKSGRRNDIWKEIDDKVRQNWSKFDEEFEGLDIEKEEFLAKATNFVSIFSSFSYI